MSASLPVYRIALVRERGLPAPTRPIHRPADAAEILRKLFQDADREVFAVLCVDIRHRVVAANVVSVGSLDCAPVHPREAFKCAILANAAAIIVGHVHPSGDPEPSRQDHRITERLAKGGDLLGIAVLDHIIVGDGRYVSLRERGALDVRGERQSCS